MLKVVNHAGLEQEHLWSHEEAVGDKAAFGLYDWLDSAHPITIMPMSAYADHEMWAFRILGSELQTRIYQIKRGARSRSGDQLSPPYRELPSCRKWTAHPEQTEALLKGKRQPNMSLMFRRRQFLLRAGHPPNCQSQTWRD